MVKKSIPSVSCYIYKQDNQKHFLTIRVIVNILLTFFFQVVKIQGGPK